MSPSAGQGKKCKLNGYTDSNLFGDIDERKSIADYIFVL